MKRILMLMALTISATAHSAWLVSSVTTTDLGTLGGTKSAAVDINESGRIVGWSDSLLGHRNAFVYQNGSMSFVIPGLASWPSQATGINDSGVIVGYMIEQSIPGSPSYGYRSTNETLTILWGEESEWGYKGTEARAINNAGVIAGRWQFSPLQNYGAMMWWPNTSSVELESLLPDPKPFPYSEADDINNAGDMVGWSGYYQRLIHWQWQSDFQLTRNFVPYPPGGTPGSYPMFDGGGINNRGEIVGYALRYMGNGKANWSAVYWNGVSSNSELIGTLPGGKQSWAEDINDGDFIVGYSEANDLLPPPLFSPTYVRAFLYHRDLGMYALPSLPAIGPYGACHAYALNERKTTGFMDVVGMCEGNGVSHAVRWTVKILPVRG